MSCMADGWFEFVPLCSYSNTNHYNYKHSLTFFDSVSMSSSTSFVSTSSGSVLSFVERNLMARSRTISSP